MAGEILPIITVRHLPMKESLRTRVSLLPRKGRCFLAKSRALMHSFRANKLLLISAPSYLVLVLVFFTSPPRSLPAKSIKLIFPCFLPVPTFLRLISNIAWDLEELSFMPVLPTILDFRPLLINYCRLSILGTIFSLSPTMLTFSFLSTLIAQASLLFRRSYAFPQ